MAIEIFPQCSEFVVFVFVLLVFILLSVGITILILLAIRAFNGSANIFQVGRKRASILEDAFL